MRVGSIAGLAVLGLLAAAVATAATLYAADYGLEATVVGKQCRSGGFLSQQADNAVTVRTKLLALEHTVAGLTDQQCQAVNAGNHVVHHVRSGRTLLYQREGGACLYDSAARVGAACAG